MSSSMSSSIRFPSIHLDPVRKSLRRDGLFGFLPRSVGGSIRSRATSARKHPTGCLAEPLRKFARRHLPDEIFQTKSTRRNLEVAPVDPTTLCISVVHSHLFRILGDFPCVSRLAARMAGTSVEPVFLNKSTFGGWFGAPPANPPDLVDNQVFPFH